MVEFHEDLAALLQPIDGVRPHPQNYNNGDTERLMESIEVNGMYRPIYVQKSTGYIIAGNHTWTACKELGATEVPVVYLDVNDEQAFRVMIADNRIASLAMPDYGELTQLLTRLSGTEIALQGTGYRPEDLRVIEALAEIPLETNEFGTWPTFTVQLPPHVIKAFRDMTREADTDRDRFELLLRLAGWEGS